MELAAKFEHIGDNTQHFTTPAAEEKYVRDRVQLISDLESLIQRQVLSPIKDTVEIPPNSKSVIYAVFQPTAGTLQGAFQRRVKCDGKIIAKLVSYDKSLDPRPADERANVLPEVEIVTRAKVCKSTLNIAQHNIQFGILRKHEIR